MLFIMSNMLFGLRSTPQSEGTPMNNKRQMVDIEDTESLQILSDFVKEKSKLDAKKWSPLLHRTQNSLDWIKETKRNGSTQGFQNKNIVGLIEVRLLNYFRPREGFQDPSSLITLYEDESEKDRSTRMVWRLSFAGAKNESYIAFVDATGGKMIGIYMTPEG